MKMTFQLDFFFQVCGWCSGQNLYLNDLKKFYEVWSFDSILDCNWVEISSVNKYLDIQILREKKKKKNHQYASRI